MVMDEESIYVPTEGDIISHPIFGDLRVKHVVKPHNRTYLHLTNGTWSIILPLSDIRCIKIYVS